MKHLSRNLLTLFLFLFTFLSFSGNVSAKTYYDTKLNHINKEISLIQQPAGMVNFDVYGDYSSISSKADFNRDGDAETVRIRRKKKTLTVEINGKKAVSVTVKKNFAFASFKSYKVGKNYLAVFMYGDSYMNKGTGKIYKWGKGHKLTLLKTYHAKGRLYICPKNNVMIIKDAQQLTKKEWTKTLKSKYSKWKNTSNVHLAKTVYRKYSYADGKLKSKGDDTYYRIWK